MFHEPRRRLGRSRPAGRRATSSATARYVNLEGRLQRLRRAVIPPAPDELAWIAKLAERFDVAIPPYASAVFAELSERIYDGLPFGEVGEQAAAAHPQRGAARPSCRGAGGRRRARACASSATGRSSPGPAVERVPELAVPAARRRGRALARGREPSRDRERRRRPRLARTAPRSSCARGSTARLRAGVVRIAERARGRAGRRRGGDEA